MQTVCPEYHTARASGTATLLNPIPYEAHYFGHKLHMDQNEKLVMFGVTHVAAIDGFSRKIVGFITLPIKNPKAIYDHLFRYVLQHADVNCFRCYPSAYLYSPIITTYGLWDQVRVDHGREFCLVLHVQELLAHLRTNCDREPFRQTQSTRVSLGHRPLLVLC